MIDFLIIGQGIAGSILAYLLIKRGQRVFIVDDSPPSFISKSLNKVVNISDNGILLKYSDLIYPKVKSLLGNSFSLKVIGGLITPVTGKRFVKTWMADQLIPFAENFYTSLERELKSNFYSPVPIVRLFSNPQQANDWSVKQADPLYRKYCDPEYNFSNPDINIPGGYTTFKGGAIVDGIELLSSLYTFFNTAEVIKHCLFNVNDIHRTETEIYWENIKARAVIFCEGWKAVENPFFSDLPFMPAKGELIVIKAEHLKLNELVNRGIFIRPLGNALYLVGSTYKWDDLSLTTSNEARMELEDKLKLILKSKYKVVEQLAGIRPTVQGRRPFIGSHREFKNIHLFNGLGTKGLLLAPFFASHFCDHLLTGTPLLADIDIKRFYNIQDKKP